MAIENQQPEWQPTSMIPVFHEMTEDMLKSADEQLNNLNQARHKPHLLDDATITRVINAYTEQQQMIPVHQEQCKRWREETLNRRQLTWVKEIEDTVELLNKTITDILKLAREIGKNTIDKILQKDDAELGLEWLLGEVDLPE